MRFCNEDHITQSDSLSLGTRPTLYNAKIWVYFCVKLQIFIELQY